MQKEYPIEYFVPLNNNENLLGRISVNKLEDEFLAEIDIVLKESKKIWRHVDILYKQESEEDAKDQAISKLSHFLVSAK